MVIQLKRRFPPNNLQKQVQVEKSMIPQPIPTSIVNKQEELETDNGKEILVEDDNEYYLPILFGKIKNFFDEKGKQRLEDTKNGIIHIGNLTSCIRQSMISEQYPIEMTIHDYCNFMDGLDSEKIIVNILDKGRNNLDEKGDYQKDIVFDSFVAHPDYIDNDDNDNTVIFELKSTAKIHPFILSDDILKSYIRQIVFYMVLENIEKGRILIRYRLPYFPNYTKIPMEARVLIPDLAPEDNLYKLQFHKDTGQFPFYSVRLSIPLDAPIRQQIKDGLVDVVKPLYLKGDITQIPILDDRDKNWKCQSYCKYKDICYSIPDEQRDPQKRLILLNKHIDGSTNKVKRFGRRKDKNVSVTSQS